MKQAVSGHLCRCGTYPNIFKATLAAAARVRRNDRGQRDEQHRLRASDTSATASSATSIKPSRARCRTMNRRRCPPNDQLAVIGKRMPRVDALQKVTGQAKYTFDVQLDGMLYGCTVSSTVAHARIKSIDTSEAERYPGVRAVHVLDRVMMTAQLRDPGDEAKQRYPTVRYLGQPIAGIAATTRASGSRSCATGAHRVRTACRTSSRWSRRCSRMHRSIFPGPTEQPATAGGGGAAKGLGQKGNLRGPAKNRTRRHRAGLRASRCHRRARVSHASADARADGNARHRRRLARRWADDLRIDAVHVERARRSRRSLRAGSNRRSASSANSPAAASARSTASATTARSRFICRAKRRAPVRFMLDRREEHVTVGNRPATLQRLKIGAKRDGTLTAVQLHSFGTGGVAAGAGVGSCHSRMYHVRECCRPSTTTSSRTPVLRGISRSRARCKASSRSSRRIDEIAHRLSIDPIELRDRIDTRRHRRLQSTQGRAPARREAVRLAATQSHPRADTGPIKRGIGMAQSQWFYIVHKDTRVRSARARRRHRPGVQQLAGHRHRNAHGVRTSRRRGIGLARSKTSTRASAIRTIPPARRRAAVASRAR